MDVFRLLLCLGLGVLLWRAQIRGVRPIREFFLWGVDYPFQFLVTATFILVIWGALGGAFGLQGLFLDEDPLTQVLIGGTVMLLFAAIVVHYVALGSSRRGWWASLHGVTGVLRGLEAVTAADRPVQAALANGFLERLTAADIEALDVVARREEADPAGQRDPRTPLDLELRDALESEPFRLLVAPAIFLVKGFGLVLLVGLVPTLVIPLIERDPQAVLERLPWLVGVCLGDVVGIVLCCWTTAWLARAAGWETRQDEILATLRRWEAERGAAAVAATLPPPVRRTAAPDWLVVLAWFFVVHAAVTLLLPRPVTARWIDVPERNLAISRPGGWPGVTTIFDQFPWLPAGVLAAEAAAAGLLTAGQLRLAHVTTGARWIAAWRPLAASLLDAVLHVLRSDWLHRLAIGAAAVIAVTAVAVTIAIRPEATHSAWIGLRGYASLGTILVGWIGIFWLATHAAVGGGARTAVEQRAAVIGLGGLAVLHVLGAPPALVAPLAAAGAILSGSRTLASLRVGDPPAWLRPGWAAVLAIVAALSLGGAWQFGTIRVAAGVWLGLAVVFLGSTSLTHVATGQPALLYPLTVLLGYVAFAIPYATLGERWKSALPAAGSIACLIALMAAGYAILVHARPRSALLTVAAACGVAILVNGTALFVAPNEFKGTFPNLADYYALPVYLDSRDYFRDTTPSTAQLRNRAVTEDFDRMARQGYSERLATVYFTVRPLERRNDDSHAVVLDVEDPRSRLRAVAGDTLGLAAEEWFTIRLDGADCIALAEEPFYRRIYRLFGYDALHMVRNGIIRGPRRRLVPAGGGAAEPSRADVTPYTFLTAAEDDHAAAEDAADAADAATLGLRLRGLAAEYEELGAEYALIQMNWRGRVVEVRHEPQADVYRVEFTLPAGFPPPDEPQLRTMQSWMERCHLDTLRPAESAAALPERFALARSPGGRAGDCLVLEDARTDAPVPVGVFLAGVPDPAAHDPAFSPYWPTPEALRRTIAATPPSAPLPAEAERPDADPAAGFTLRSAHDRGLFASPDPAVRLLESPPTTATEFTVALYNAGRLRRGDRLIVSWNGRHGTASGPDLVRAAVCEVADLDANPPDTVRAADPPSLPPGATWARLVPVSRLPAAAATAVVPAAASAGAANLAPPSAGLVVGQWQNLSLLNNAEVLLAWKNLVGPRWQDRKPKLVIVTVSGGGIRASVWASVVLRKLEATLGADFPYHVRLVTGASGGMVAGSYYVTSLRPPTAEVLAGGRASFADLHGISIGDFVDRMALDQLDAVAGRMLFADLPATLNPFMRQGDRGRTLEQTWIRWTGGPQSPLGRPLQSYAADERLGWRPSLVFTPMMVEDGRRLLISNIDLAFATRNVGGLLLEPSSRKIERPAIQGGDFDQSIHEEDEVFSLSAVEFFRLFPRAGDFQVTTAIRMSASFPWVSPAFNLPTLPPRRVVDAAYYDNYGINLSALWLSKMGQWLQENTSGVLVVQVRDKVSQGARTEIDFDRVGGGDTLLDRLVWHGGSRLVRPGLQPLSTPLVGVTNARQWTMAFRNDEQVDLQDLLFDELSGRDFFRTVVFECPVDVSLNWRLTEREKAILLGGFGRPDAAPEDELARVKDYLTGRDSYEFHKWRLDNRNRPTFRRELKARYDEQLRALGVTATDRLSLEESQSLYENVVKNLKRLELLTDWWRTGRTQAAR